VGSPATASAAAASASGKASITVVTDVPGSPSPSTPSPSTPPSTTVVVGAVVVGVVVLVVGVPAPLDMAGKINRAAMVASSTPQLRVSIRRRSARNTAMEAAAPSANTLGWPCSRAMGMSSCTAT